MELNFLHISMALYDHINSFIASTLILEFIYIFSTLIIGGLIIILMSNHLLKSVAKLKSKYENKNRGAREQMEDRKLLPALRMQYFHNRFVYVKSYDMFGWRSGGYLDDQLMRKLVLFVETVPELRTNYIWDGRAVTERTTGEKLVSTPWVLSVVQQWENL
jgi:hypothetical protein